MKKLIFVFVFLLSISFLSAHRLSEKRYDRWFRDYTILWFGHEVSPNWTKAVGLAESNLKPDAVSPANAHGLMQFIPGSWTWMAEGTPFEGQSPYDPEASIFVACKYLKWIWDKFPRAEKFHRKALSNASYNSGLGNINKARRKCLDNGTLFQLPCMRFQFCDPEIWDWPHTENHLVTLPRFQHETRTYVKRIRDFEEALEALP